MNLTVLGAGAWGTALAVAASARHDVCLWARDAEQASAMRADRRNRRYLDEVTLPATLAITDGFEDALRHAWSGAASVIAASDADRLLIVATPMAGLEPMLRRIEAKRLAWTASRTASTDPVRCGVMWLSKGFQSDTGSLGHEVAARLGLGMPVGVLSGPSFALEVALGQPTALVAASRDAALCETAVRAFHSDTLRIYTSDDPIGVEVGGAVKNVLAIATGIVDGLASDAPVAGGLGLNARAAIVTRGLAEMTRLGQALGARPETFMGLSGLGDLVLTATGSLSRNRKVGLLLAQGLPLDRILANLGHVAEGVPTAPTVLRRARESGVDMPITEAVVDVLEGRCSPRQAVQRLMGRDARPEFR
ncbi:MAG: hypothetical protein JWQ11_2187 [Rhizobacter sp.]|nr:hypothetical protein [Rhizobacter sp.]